MFKNVKIRSKIILSFTGVIFLLLLIVSITFYEINIYKSHVNRIIELRSPTVLNTARMINGVNHSLAALRGWMLLGKDKFEKERKRAWKNEINATLSKMEKVAKNWTNPENVKRFKKIKELFKKFKNAQESVMGFLATGQDINNAEKMGSAKKTLGKTAAPTAFEIKKILKAMEGNQEELALKDSKKAKEAEEELTFLLFLVAGIALVIASTLAVFLTRSITQPLKKAVDAANSLAAGDLTIQIEVKSNDEIGQLSSAMKNMVEKLNTIMGELVDSASQLSATSEELNASASSLADGAQNQAASVEEASASTEEMTSGIKQVADHSVNMQDKSNKSLKDGQKYKDVMSQVVEEMININKSTEKIGNIVSVINDIADQTNLLSLNAAIEAARAGEHGRGFAVVAEEISKLATRSAESTKEIESLVSETVTRVNQGVNSVKSSSESFDAIVGTIEENNNIANDIATSMEEQHQASEQIQKATEEINNLTQSVSSSAEEMSASTTELQGLAERLNSIVMNFKISENGAIETKKVQALTLDKN